MATARACKAARDAALLAARRPPFATLLRGRRPLAACIAHVRVRRAPESGQAPSPRPASRMAFEFNVRFQRDGLAAVRGPRSYSLDVDGASNNLTPDQVAAKVAALRPALS